MKDIYGNIFDCNDKVALVYHPEAYKFFLELGIVKEIKKNYIKVSLSNTCECSFKRNTNDVIARAIKLNNYKKSNSKSGIKDAIGQLVTIGDRVAFQLPIVGGNTCKGFYDAGVITKITDKYVFATDKNGIEKRKGFNHIVKV